MPMIKYVPIIDVVYTLNVFLYIICFMIAMTSVPVIYFNLLPISYMLTFNFFLAPFVFTFILVFYNIFLKIYRLVRK